MQTAFLTREGYNKLQEELDFLRDERRNEIADRLHEALADGGDPIENAEYEAAKHEQAFVEGRIKELEFLLAKAKVFESQDIPADVIQFGSAVTIQEDGLEPETFVIVGSAEAKAREGKISNESPLGQALEGHKAGDLVEVDAPAGSFTVKVVKVG
ncbi:MAG: transcription elongation factor GreA [Anaerolineaceae bacterium]|nr:transcription elongation factor GreA [Anaerolineaceae bacterium]